MQIWDFTPMIDLLTLLVGKILLALSAVAGAIVSVGFAIWGFRQVIIWFGYDEFGRIVRRRDSGAYKKYKKKFQEERAYEREYSRYAKKRKKQDEFKERYAREDRSFYDLEYGEKPRKRQSRGRYNEHYDDYEEDYT